MRDLKEMCKKVKKHSDICKSACLTWGDRERLACFLGCHRPLCGVHAGILPHSAKISCSCGHKMRLAPSR